MRALILAAGKGSRLGAGIPKILVKVAGTTILERHTDSLAKMEITPDRVTVVTGFRAHDVVSACVPLGLDTLYNPRWDVPGTYSSFAILPPTDDTVLILHGDLVWEPGLGIEALKQTGDLVVPVDPGNRKDSEAMKAEIRENRILHLSKSLSFSRSAGESMGMFVVRNHGRVCELSMYLLKDIRSNFDDAVNIAAGNLCTAACVTDRHRWEEIDTPGDLEAAETRFS